MNNWILNKLADFLDLSVFEEIICLIHQKPNDRDLDNYIESCLDLSNPLHKEFLLELKKKRARDGVLTGYRKSNDDNYDSVKVKDKKKNKGKESKVKISMDSSQLEKNEKKTKFINFYDPSKKNSFVLLKGRNKCDCEARIHDLINNCINCGKIICKQEGTGPCFFCSEPVRLEHKSASLTEKTGQSNLLDTKVIDRQINNVNSVLEERNKLLEYDRDSTKRNQVIDDESDYYIMSNNSWLSKSERQKMLQRDKELSELKLLSRKLKNITIDLSNLSVLEEDESNNHDLKLELMMNPTSYNHKNHDSKFQCPNLKINELKYINQGLPELCSKNASDLKLRRVQDKEIIEMIDEGLCMTVHQPYASLLISGINLHVGKKWYSSHRGRLWIHAASKKPSSTEISSIENKCRNLNKNHEIAFPNVYNTNLLLGYVSVITILSQNEYQKKYPECDLHSPYVFICADPHEIALKIAMQGKHKIYKLEKKIHQTAMKEECKVKKLNDESLD